MKRPNPTGPAPRRRASALAGLLVAAAGCGGFYVEAEQPEACITQNAVEIPVTVQGVSGSFSQELSYDIGKWFPDLAGATASPDRIVRFLRLQVKVPAAQVGVYLDWLGTFDVTLLPAPGSALQEIAVLRYQKGPGRQLITELDVPSTVSGQNLAEYLQQGVVHFRFAGSGQGVLPAGAWVVNVGGCFYAKVRKGLGDVLR